MNNTITKKNGSEKTIVMKKYNQNAEAKTMGQLLLNVMLKDIKSLIENKES